MCAPTDSLLFAEDLVVFIARKHKFSWKSKIRIWRLRPALETRFSPIIGEAIFRIMSETENERQRVMASLAENRIPVASHIRGVHVNYEENFHELYFLVRCAWICGLFISSRSEDPGALEKAVFMIADDLHRIPDPKFISDDIWAQVEDCAEDLMIFDLPFLRGAIAPESVRYTRVQIARFQ